MCGYLTFDLGKMPVLGQIPLIEVTYNGFNLHY